MSPRWNDLRDRLDDLRCRFEALSPLQKVVAGAAAVIAVALLLHVFALALLLLLAAIVLLLVAGWFEEIVWLMRQPDSVFPGRYDKLIWAALLVLLPPLGMPALWSFRRSMQATNAKPEPVSWRDWM